MAADDRRIITGTHVVVKEGNVMEDTSVHKYIMKTSPGKSLGGKSILTDMEADQDFVTSSRWYQGDNKGTALAVDGVTFPKSVTDSITNDVEFLYVKNLDTTQDCHVSLTTATTWNGTWANLTDDGHWYTGTDYTKKSPSYDGRWDEGMYIIVPPGGSVHLRGDSTGHLNMEHVRFRSSGSTAINIEYVLAE